MSLALGSVLAGRYRILARLGVGGMGSVYRAEDLRLPGRMWAIKELLADPSTPPDEMVTAIKRFDAEIELMAHLASPRIPAVVDRFREGDRHYFVMDFVPGASLETRLTQANRPLPERDVLGWVVQVCDVLAYIHAQHPPIILRDLKPANVMVTPEGEVRVIDFGIARTYKPGKLTNTENLGTLLYASPEHIGQQAQTDSRSDVYSVGATLYHLLTNQEPTPMETPAPGAVRRLNPAVSAATEAIIRRAMQINPAMRFQTAAEMSAALTQSLASLAATSTAPARTVNSRPPPQPVPRQSVPRLARPQGGVVCMQCGHLNRTGARFCARDGMPLPGASGIPATQAPARGPAAHITRATTPPAASVAAPASMSARRPIVTVPVTASTAELSAQRGAQAFTSGRFPLAARHLEAAAAQGRATYDVLMLLGQTYRRMGRPRDASSQFERAGRLRPTAEAFYEQGLAEREAGRSAQAQVALLRARQLDPQDPLVAHQLGLVCLEQGQLTQAEGELQEGLRLRAEHPGILAALGRVRAAQRQWAEAAGFFRRAVAADPTDAGAHLDLGRALLALRRLTEATRAIEESTRLAPGSAEAQIALGMCYHAQGKRRPARNALERALALEPNDPEAQRLLKQI
jgi:serine/threonine protein kinase/tetratricopeptide (TPR) repeat protein